MSDGWIERLRDGGMGLDGGRDERDERYGGMEGWRDGGMEGWMGGRDGWEGWMALLNEQKLISYHVATYSC